MGLRVRAVLLVLSLLAIVALAVPFGLTMADRRTATFTAERARQTAALAASAAMPDAPLQRLADRYHELYGEPVLVVDTAGQTLAGSGIDGASPGVRSAVEHALVDAPAPPWRRIWPWDHRRVLVTAGVRSDGELVGAVVVAADPAAAARAIGVGWLWLALGCVCLIVVALLIAGTLTRWVLRPIHGLERAVAEMTDGVTGPPANVAGPPELREFTSAFNTMAQAVRASLDRQRRLVADASHQLRNPLAAIRLRADSLDEMVTEGGRATYQSMSVELDRLEHLLSQLLRLARAEELGHSRRLGLSEPVGDPTDLADVVQERLAFWGPVADGNGQLLRRGADAAAQPAVQLARHEVEQLIDVAVDNALRYAGSGATITVATAIHADSVELGVSDDGPGLPQEDLSRATDRFWRGRRDRSGTGLGLAIVGEIVAGHGGTVDVDTAPEGGLLVRYHLPMAGTPAC